MILRLIATALLALLAIAPAHAADYLMRTGTITFKGTQQGEVFAGQFKLFTGTFSFDAKQFAAGKFDVSIDLASASTENSERDEALRGPDFFAVERFPKAHFVTGTITQVDPTHFRAESTLTIRDSAGAVRVLFRDAHRRQRASGRQRDTESHRVRSGRRRVGRRDDDRARCPRRRRCRPRPETLIPVALPERRSIRP